MVFQNPDNQFVSSVVDEDIAFGLENYDTPAEIIPQKVEEALALVGMEGFGKMPPHMLSCGQKQRIAIAGVLAVDPDIIIFDEATAMLDPQGRDEVLDTARRLHAQAHKTVIMISHYIEEAIFLRTASSLFMTARSSRRAPARNADGLALMRRTACCRRCQSGLIMSEKAGIVLPRCPADGR
jgi:energy-coupling factor transporter ATP-binding protein EcfA2